MRTLPDTQCLHCKGRPRTADEGSEGLQGYTSTLSLTSVLDGGGWSVPRQGRLASGKETRYLLYRRLDWPQGRSLRVRNICPPTRIFFVFSCTFFLTHFLHPRVCIGNLNERRSVFTHRSLYFPTLFFRNTTCFGCHQPSSGVSNSKLKHRFKKQL